MAQTNKAYFHGDAVGENGGSSPGSKSDDNLFKKESKISRLTTLEKILGLLLVAAIIAVVALIIVVVEEKRDDDGDSSSTNGEFTQGSQVCLSSDCVVAAARLQESIDHNVDPCEDFYEFSCGRWIKERVIPEDRSSFTTFTVLRNQVTIVVKNLLETEIDDNDPDYINKAKRFYTSCMDTDKIEKIGDVAFKDLLDTRFGGWPVVTPGWTEANFDIVDMASGIWQLGNSAIFQFYASVNSKNSTQRILMIDQVGLGMPGQKYYLVARNDTMLMAYQNLLYSTALLMGVANETVAKKEIEDLVDFEIELARISIPDEERRDSNALYNPMTLEQVHNNYSQAFNWKKFIKDLMALDGIDVTDVTNEEIIINRSPAYFEALTSLLDRTPKRVQANYMVWKVVISLIAKQSEKYRNLLKVYNKALYGQASESPRYETCSSITTNYMGLSVGKLFIKDNFNADAKLQASEMIDNLQFAFDELLTELDWMDENTKQVAKEKNRYIDPKIGYPEELNNQTYLQIYYENFTYVADDYFHNVLNSRMESFKINLRRLRLPVDKQKWTTPPSTVNAYYSSSNNRIMFPAGIFQPPFFSPKNPKSLNYGGIGVVIGHEITHGFDDRGRQYDKDGNLVQWWSESAIDKFKDKAKCIVEQYGNFTVKEVNMKLNGINTQGENIADNGGLKESFRAYRNWVASQGKEEAPLPGLDFTHNQLFFINFGQLWCSLMRDGDAINRIRTGVHSPGRFRVIGSVQNSPDFNEAFKCKPGSPMNKEPKCSVW